MMNETVRTIMERFSCRDFADTPLTELQISTIAKAAAAAPSAMNRQPWHVIMITDKQLIDELDAVGMHIIGASDDKTMYERMKARGGRLFYNAPCMVMVASDGSSHAAMDCGILSQNVALAAHSLGLGSVICGMAGIPLSGSRGDEFKQRMQFPKGYDFGIAILVGTVKSAKEPHEPDMSKITFIGS